MTLAENIAHAPGKGKEQKISFTLMHKTGGILTKRMKLIGGRVEKDSSECRMNRGRAETVTLTPEKFGPFLQGLQSNQALVHGVSIYDDAGILSGKKLKTTADEEPKRTPEGLPIISRTKDFFHYPDGPGLLMLDHDKARTNAVALDPEKALKGYSPEELTTTIAGFFESIKGAARVAVCSTSSCIYNADTGDELRGKRAGFHLYLFPRNATDTPRFLDVLGKRLILAGYGRVEFSRSGAVLMRTPVDLLVASPERLDFVAGAVCGKGLEQRLPAPEYQPGGLLDTEGLKDLNPEEERTYQAIIHQLKAKGTPDQESIKGAYLEQEAEKLSSKSGGMVSMEQARETVKARQHHILVDDDLLFFAHLKKTVSVGHALDNGPEFNKKPCADPLEPEYGGSSMSKAVFYWNEGKNPLINSYAHGGIKYQFRRFKNDDTGEQHDSPLPLTKKNDTSDPFPFDVLGPIMAGACTDIQKTVQAPDALIAQSVLASANLAVQPLRNVDIDGRVSPLSLFLLTIAATGERKSAVDEIVLKPHRDAEYQAEQNMETSISIYEMEQAAWDQEKTALVKDKKRTSAKKRPALEQLEQQKPEKPLDQKRLVSDFTFEGLYKLFQAGVPSKGLFADEGGQVTGGHGMRQDTIMGTAAGLSKFWDGAPVNRIRVIDGASSLYGRRLAVHLMMQEKVGLDFFNNEILRDQGLGSRMLSAWPTSTVGRRMYKPVNVHETEGVRQFYQQITGLLAQSMPFKEGRNEKELDPPAMRLSPEAKRAWEGFYNQVETASGPKQDLAPIRGLANKAAGHAARIAGTVQLFEDPAAVEIQAEAMNCGIEALGWYLDEALRISGSSNPAQHLIQAKEVLRWIHDCGLKVVALPDIYQYSPVRSAGVARKVVETLKAHNHLLEPKLDGEKKSPILCKNGKKSREWCEVHPESSKSFFDE